MSIKTFSVIILFFSSISAVNGEKSDSESKIYLKIYEYIFDFLSKKGPVYDCPEDTTPEIFSCMPNIQVNSCLHSFSKSGAESWFIEYLFGSEWLSIDLVEGKSNFDSLFFNKKIQQKSRQSKKINNSDCSFYCNLEFSQILFNDRRTFAISFSFLTIEHSKYLFCFSFRKKLNFWKIEKCKVKPH
jgi:hypothetical protein